MKKTLCMELAPLNTYCLSCAFFLSLLLSALPIHAQEWDTGKPHHLSVLLGGTHMIDSEENGATIGIDYEYRVNDILGVGLIVEHASSVIYAETILAVADIHTPSGIIVQVGPGIEFGNHHDRFLLRIGGLYEFEFDSWTLSPQLHFDMAENAEDSLVFGFAFGKAF